MVLQKIGAQAYIYAWLVLSVRACVTVRPLRLCDHLCNALNRSSLGNFLCIRLDRHSLSLPQTPTYVYLMITMIHSVTFSGEVQRTRE
jgi:hypothetical protein